MSILANWIKLYPEEPILLIHKEYISHHQHIYIGDFSTLDSILDKKSTVAKDIADYIISKVYTKSEIGEFCQCSACVVGRIYVSMSLLKEPVVPCINTNHLFKFLDYVFQKTSTKFLTLVLKAITNKCIFNVEDAYRRLYIVEDNPEAKLIKILLSMTICRKANVFILKNKDLTGIS